MSATETPKVPKSKSHVNTERRHSFFQQVKGMFFGKLDGEEDGELLGWQADSEKAYLEQDPIKTRVMLYAVSVSVCLLILWAAIAEVHEVTRGEAKVVPSRQVQIVQSLDGGVLTDILVREGQIVEKGQLLFQIDQTRFASSLREKEIEMIGLQIRAARLQAIAEGQPFEVDAQYQEQFPSVVEQEIQLYESLRAELQSETRIAEEQLSQRRQEKQEVKAKITQLENGFSLADKELRMTRPLVQSGAVSEVELLRLERDVSNLRGELNQARAQDRRLVSAISEAERKIDDVVLTFTNAIREELSDVTTRINALRESNLGLSDKVKQTAIQSPVKGTVKRLYYNTLGGVVLPGKEVVEIVPLDDTLLLEARIRPQDIAFLRPGQDAIVKFTAYDFVVYGGLEGVVERIGVDTLTDEDGNPYYNVHVRTLESSLGDDKPIIPGMVAEVDILTGQKTILAYIIKPVLRAKQYALTER
ncbi:HlyD family type I secretion periplasmic adaptor subunit [Aurantivibrio plasticivorans]